MACLLFLVSRFSNAVNLTDGIDGLVAGLGTISFGYLCNYCLETTTI